MSDIANRLGDEAEYLLGHRCSTIPSDQLHLPGPDFVERVMLASDRRPGVLRNLQSLFDHCRLGGSGYLSILPVEQGVEHSAGASFAPNPITSCAWPSRAAATRWPPPSVCSARSGANTPIASRFWSSSTTTSC